MHTTGKIMIAGTHSGVGKTTITMGLIAALRRQGLQVQPFKAGPDYIDPTYHTLAAGRPCRNIDTWMVPPARVFSLFLKAIQDVDAAVIEGVMGVFDGYSYDSEDGSSAQIAKLVDAPVVLVLDVGKVARSSGAIAKGYANFDKALNIAGYILNRCGSVNHYEGTKLAVEQATGRPVLGWLPKNIDLHIPERHLGLVPTNERGELTTLIDHAADAVEQYFDLDQMLTISQAGPPMPAPGLSSTISDNSRHQLPATPLPTPTIAVARDEAFGFYYEDNLDLLRESNARVVFFSPVADNDLPAGTSGIYLGGGFPEIYAARLAANSPLKTALQHAYAAKMPIYAECGGFMYLTEAIIDLDGQRHPMVGLVPGLTRMQPRLMSLGYRVVESPSGNFLLPKGAATRGHEFHWSSWDNAADSPAWLIRPRRDSDSPRLDGYANKKLIASYVHLHFAHEPKIAQRFVQACQAWASRSL
jgi:cobyrinic acid a,c-diamide synthase